MLLRALSRFGGFDFGACTVELPRRARGDELLKPGELLALRQRLRLLSVKHDLVSVIACAFDHRTRMLDRKSVV